MSKYFQRKDGLYETTRTIKGRRIRFYGHSAAEIDRKILEYNVDLKRGRKFPAVADEWYQQREAELAYSSYRVYGFAVERVKKHFTGRIGEIKPLDVKRYITEFERKGYARETVRIELSTLKQIFSYAVLAGDIDVNPAAEVNHGRNLPRKRRGALTEEQEALVESCRTGKWWLLGLMLLYTGCRRGELLALNWQDIDRENGWIHVTKKLNYAFGNTPHLEHDLKSENGRRDIPLLAPLAEALPTDRRIGLVFGDEDGNYLTASKLGRVWLEYCHDAGLTEWQYDTHNRPVELPAITPHCFRHSFATICFEAGIDPKTTASYVGDTEQVVQTVYEELRNARRESGTDKLNAYLANRRARAAEL